MTATLTAPTGHLTVASAAKTLNPERIDFWETMPLATIRDAAVAAGSSMEGACWEILLETRLVRELNITLLHSDGSARNLADLPL